MTVPQLIYILDDLDSVHVALDGTIIEPDGTEWDVVDFVTPMSELESLAAKLSELRKALAWAKRAPNYKEPK